MRIKVIKVVVEGKVGYVKAAGFLMGTSTPIVDNPLEAVDYSKEENAVDLERDLKLLNIAGDELTSRSGIRVETAQVVELDVEVRFTEVSSREARPLRKMPNKTA